MALMADGLSDQQPFIGGVSKDDSSGKPPPVYYDASSTPRMRYIVGGTIGIVIFTLLISIIVVIVESVKNNPLFSLLLISLIAFAQVEFFLVFFIYKGKMPRPYVWTIFVVAGFVIVEAICTIIVVATT